MFIFELFQTLDYLEADKDIINMSVNVRKRCINVSQTYTVISEIESKINTSTGDRFNEKLPFYHLFLSYAYHTISEWTNAIQFAERAIQLFNNNRQVQNKAVSYWFLGLLFCPYENFTRAEENISHAIKCVNHLNEELCRSGQYNIPYKEEKFQYPNIIDAISKSFFELKNKILDQLSHHNNELLLPFDFFSIIAQQLSIPEEADYLTEWLRAITHTDSLTQLDDDSFFIDQLVERLDQIRDESDEGVLIRILLAHRHNFNYYINKQRGNEAEILIQDALSLSQSETSNFCLARSYLALLQYLQDRQGPGRSYLEDALQWLDKAKQEYKRFDFINNFEEIQDLQNDISSWVFPFKFVYPENQVADVLPSRYIGRSKTKQSTKRSQTSSSHKHQPTSKKPLLPFGRIFWKKGITDPKSKKTSVNDETPIVRNEFNVVGLTLKDKLQEPPPQEPPVNPPSPKSPSKPSESKIRHLIVPIDISSLDDQSAQIIPLEHKYYTKLEAFESTKAHSNNTDDASASDNNKNINRVPVIPNFSIYGWASAGPNGEAYFPHLDELGQTKSIDDTLMVELDSIDYKVNFIDTPPPTFLSNKKYGWVKITGDSMNRAGIEKDDYVLFRENRSLEHCVRRIVIALVSDMETQPPCLMVKRLIKLSGEAPCSYDGYNSELCKYLLHSESTLEYDPITGISLKKDIEIENDNQLFGDVIAIAKPSSREPND